MYYNHELKSYQNFVCCDPIKRNDARKITTILNTSVLEDVDEYLDIIKTLCPNVEVSINKNEVLKKKIYNTLKDISIKKMFKNMEFDLEDSILITLECKEEYESVYPAFIILRYTWGYYNQHDSCDITNCSSCDGMECTNLNFILDNLENVVKISDKYYLNIIIEYYKLRKIKDLEQLSNEQLFMFAHNVARQNQYYSLIFSRYIWNGNPAVISFYDEEDDFDDEIKLNNLLAGKNAKNALEYYSNKEYKKLINELTSK